MCEMIVQQLLEGVYFLIEFMQVMVLFWFMVVFFISSKDLEIEMRWVKNFGVEIGCFIFYLFLNGLQFFI